MNQLHVRDSPLVVAVNESEPTAYDSELPTFQAQDNSEMRSAEQPRLEGFEGGKQVQMEKEVAEVAQDKETVASTRSMHGDADDVEKLEVKVLMGDQADKRTEKGTEALDDSAAQRDEIMKIVLARHNGSFLREQETMKRRYNSGAGSDAARVSPAEKVSAGAATTYPKPLGPSTLQNQSQSPGVPDQFERRSLNAERVCAYVKDYDPSTTSTGDMSSSRLRKLDSAPPLSELHRLERPSTLRAISPGAYDETPGGQCRRLETLSPLGTGLPLGQSSGDCRDVVECLPLGLLSNDLEENNIQDVVAYEVEDALDSNELPKASQVDAAAGHQRRIKERRKVMHFVLVGFFLLTVTVAVVVAVVTTREVGNLSTELPSFSPSSSPSQLLYPFDNLEILFEALSDKTKESLLDPNTAQAKAWEWLLGHQNINHFEEWRKQQLFAMATFFFALEGPKWNPKYSKNWLNDTMEECSWINTDLQYMYALSAEYQKTTEYDFNACNDAGELQTIALMFLQLPSTAKPVVPPEVALLPSLSILVLPFSDIVADLSDMMPPELYQLLTMRVFVLHGNAIHGTIPEVIGQMTSLHYLLLGETQITGSLPNQVSKMSELKQFSLPWVPITGTLPTELGLLSKMTDLEIFSNSLTGTIPSELGLVTGLRELSIHINSLTGLIPTQLGLLTHMTNLKLGSNALTGTIPSELGLLTDTRWLALGTNALSGSIPEDLWQLAQLKKMDLSALPLVSGLVPDHLCYLNATNSSCSFSKNVGCSLGFDCSELLCGCDCSCSTANRVADGGRLVFEEALFHSS